MALSINDPQAETPVGELTEKTGEPKAQAVLQSLKERLQRFVVRAPDRLAEVLNQLALGYAAQPGCDRA